MGRPSLAPSQQQAAMELEAAKRMAMTPGNSGLTGIGKGKMTFSSKKVRYAMVNDGKWGIPEGLKDVRDS